MMIKWGLSVAMLLSCIACDPGTTTQTTTQTGAENALSPAPTSGTAAQSNMTSTVAIAPEAVSALADPVATAAASSIPPANPTTMVLATTDFDNPGIVVELTEATRREGVLTVKVRFRATIDQVVTETVYIGNASVDNDFYVTAGGKKYFILRDEENRPLTPDTLMIRAKRSGDQVSWWAKFPAPPTDVHTFSLSMARLAPFDGIPITDL